MQRKIQMTTNGETREIPLPSRKKMSLTQIILIGLGLIILFALLFTTMWTKARLDAKYNEVRKADAQIKSLTAENVRQEADIEAKMGMYSIQDYAENQLGLVKFENSQIEYITVRKEYVIEIPKDERNIFEKIADEIDRFLEYISE
jgi:FtsZ-interacting cell division protein ZipA